MRTTPLLTALGLGTILGSLAIWASACSSTDGLSSEGLSSEVPSPDADRDTADERRYAVDSAEVPPPLEDIADAYEAASRVQLPEVPAHEYDGLHNVYVLSEDIISGGEPLTAGALSQVAEFGVKTIISVDGKVPDVAAAEARGMRYVHVPIQYSGIEVDQLLKLAKSFRELEGPFYVHCYHGKHRGPAAAAVGRIVKDGASREQALAEMRQWCHTASKYDGLYATIASAQLPNASATEDFAFEFDSVHAFEGFRAAMISAARSWDNIKDARKRDWAIDPEHPDLVPLQEATQLHEVLAICGDQQDLAWDADDFREWLEDGIQGSEELVRALSDCSQEDAGLGPDGLPAWRARAELAYERISESCANCHSSYRDH